MVISNDSYNYFGKYFMLYLDNGTPKLYISSYKKDSDPMVHSIEEAVMCTSQQYYHAASNAWINITGSGFGLGMQNITQLTWSTYNEADDAINILGETFWNTGCSLGRFGKQCQTWSTFKNRIGVSVTPGYIWDNKNIYKWEEIRKSGNQKAWYQISSCRECLYTPNWHYSYGSCKSSSSSLAFSPWEVYSNCQSNKFDKQNEALWGKSNIKLPSFGSDFRPKPKINTPRYTIWVYNIEFPEKFSGSLTIQRDANTELTLKSHSGAKIIDLSPTNRRNLKGIQRNLANIEIYTVIDSVLLEVYYGANKELPNSNFLITTSQNINESKDTGGSTIVVIIVAIFVTLFVIVWGFLLLILSWAIYVNLKNSDTSPPTRLNNLSMQTANLSFQNLRWEARKTGLSQNQHVESKLAVMKKYEVSTNRFNTRMWAICLVSFERSEMVSTVDGCKHTFHSICIREMLITIYDRQLKGYCKPTNNMFKCPLCQSCI
jgi:hypothetical protein